MTRYLMIFWYVVHCLRLKVNPWRFFQLNANYFNSNKGIYSKQDINSLIPLRWKLKQQVDNQSHIPDKFPVFLKPEWGQNAYGIYRADSLQDLKRIRSRTENSKLTYLIQEAAAETREFEVFYVRDAEKPTNYAVLTIAEVGNKREKQYPINGIHNVFTAYTDRTPDFNGVQSAKLWKHINMIGNFRIARICIKADSEEAITAGAFHIVEINLFTPMPLNLLDSTLPRQEKIRFIKKAMFHIAENTGKILKKKKEENIFFKKLIMHYRVKS